MFATKLLVLGVVRIFQLQTLSDINPFKHIVDGARAVFRAT